MDPGILMAGANSLGSFVGSIFNPVAQSKTNKQQREWLEGMYNRQRQDALDDWHRQAAYNSPGAQMDRLKAAGLNPNLVYGSGATAEMGSPVRSSTPGSWNPTAPQIDTNALSNSLAAIYDLQIKDAQLDNMAIARRVQEQEVLLKAAQTQSTLSDAHTKDFDLKMKNDLKEINVDMAKEGLEKAKYDVDHAGIDYNTKKMTFHENIEKVKAEAKKAMNEASASQHMEKRVLQEIDNLKRDGDLKQFSINLQKLGITQSDNVFLRIMATLFGKYIPKL